MSDEEENLASGSFQLGGEPDTADGQSDVPSSDRRDFSMQQPYGVLPNDLQGFDDPASLQQFANLGIGMRSLTPQQQRNISLLKNSTASLDSASEHQRGTGSIQHQSQLSNPFQSQSQPLSSFSTHARQASRYTFANDPNSAHGPVKPTSQVLAQQSGGMQASQLKSFIAQQQQGGHSNFYSGIQGPPPGLKSTGTPPISGGGMFGQGYGFASAMGAGLGNIGAKNSNDELMRNLLRDRSGFGAATGSEQSKGK
jgi:CCR4-NOT transcription complex subunit 4